MAKDKDNVPVLFIETVEQGDSGFYLDGTQGTPYAQQLRTPTVSWIPTTGIEVYEEEIERDGKKIKIKKNRKIRHIKDCDTIYPEEQEKRGFKPNRMADKIPMDNGFANIRAEGSTLNTFQYLTAATYFLDNELRPKTASALYKSIKINERAVELLDEDEYATAAKHKIYQLRVTLGGEKGKYKYLEDKIDSYCSLFNITNETPETKLVSLLQIAVQKPKEFLNIVSKAEQTVMTEVSHALQLGVIMFDGNVAQYSEGTKMITSLGTAKNMSNDKKIEALSNYLQTAEGNNDLTELRIRTEAEKEKQFSK